MWIPLCSIHVEQTSYFQILVEYIVLHSCYFKHKRMCVCVCVCVYIYVCVCVRVRAWEREREREREREKFSGIWNKLQLQYKLFPLPLPLKQAQTIWLPLKNICILKCSLLGIWKLVICVSHSDKWMLLFFAGLFHFFVTSQLKLWPILSLWFDYHIFIYKVILCVVLNKLLQTVSSWLLWYKFIICYQEVQ